MDQLASNIRLYIGEVAAVAEENLGLEDVGVVDGGSGLISIEVAEEMKDEVDHEEATHRHRMDDVVIEAVALAEVLAITHGAGVEAVGHLEAEVGASLALLLRLQKGLEEGIRREAVVGLAVLNLRAITTNQKPKVESRDPQHGDIGHLELGHHCLYISNL